MTYKCSNFKKYSLICLSFIFVLLTLFISFFRVDNVVSADTVDNNYSFSGSNIYVPSTVTIFKDDVFIPEYNSVFSVTFNFNSTILSIDFGYVYKDVGLLIQFTEDINISSSIDYINNPISYSYSSGGADYSIRFPFDYKLDSSFNFDVVAFNLYSVVSSNLEDCYNFVDYIDKNGSRFSFRFSEPLRFFDNRIYYLSNSFTDNEYYNNGYNSGVSDGYNNGYDTGYNNGLTTGYNNGVTDGYNAGYNEGVNDSNNYTFFSLIGAVIDAPLTAFYGLFNFDLLGTNLSGFILSLLTLSIVIVVIRLALGGK